MKKNKQPSTLPDFAPDKLEDVLKIFFLSGSANGREENRTNCLKLIPVFSAAPDLLKACRLILKGWEAAKIPVLTPTQLKTLETAISKAEKKL